MQKIGFIGAGNMAYAIISGLINHGFDKNLIKISDPNKALLSQRNAEFEVEIFSDNTALASQCEVIVFAVKLQVLPVVCQALQTHLQHKPLIISIAAGGSADNIERWLGSEQAIVRTMPNTPALFNQGITGMFANTQVSPKQKSLADTILATVGRNLWVDDEDLIDAITAVSGSGPAYFFLMLEAMTKAGIELGLDKSSAQALSIQTALGAAVMADKSDDSPKQLRAKVTSPQGTTQAAIESFQAQNFAAIVARAMRAAFSRAKSMGIEANDAKISGD